MLTRRRSRAPATPTRAALAPGTVRRARGMAPGMATVRTARLDRRAALRSLMGKARPRPDRLLAVVLHAFTHSSARHRSSLIPRSAPVRVHLLLGQASADFCSLSTHESIRVMPGRTSRGALAQPMDTVRLRALSCDAIPSVCMTKCLNALCMPLGDLTALTWCKRRRVVPCSKALTPSATPEDTDAHGDGQAEETDAEDSADAADGGGGDGGDDEDADGDDDAHSDASDDDGWQTEDVWATETPGTAAAAAAAAAEARTVLPDELDEAALDRISEVYVVDRHNATEIAGITGTVPSNKVARITAGAGALPLNSAEKKKSTIKAVLGDFPRFVVQLWFEVGHGAFHLPHHTTRMTVLCVVE